MPAEFRPRGLLEHLSRHGVDYVVIGGIAAVLHGSERNTFDLDVCPAQDPVNLQALGEALVGIEARLRGIEEDLPFVPDGATLAGVEILTLDTALGPLDVLMRPAGAPAYEALRRRAQRMDTGGHAVLVASLEDLIGMKTESDRPKDREDVERLEALALLRRRLSRRATGAPDTD
jgi:hypothetical protein